MKLKWTQTALSDLKHIYTYIAEENIIAAKNTISKIQKGVQQIQKYPQVGKKGRVQETKEFIIPNSFYIIIYREKNSTIEILSILHTARKWP